MAFDPAIPSNDELLINFPALCRANWDAIVLLTAASLLITNAKVSASAAIADTKLAQITTAAKVSGAALTLLTSVPSGAGVLPDANSPNKLKADASDTTPQYLDSLIDTAVFQISASDFLQLKDGGVETVKLKNGSASPGNSKYYGTNAGGTKGFFDVPDISAIDADKVDGLHAAATPVANKLLALDVSAKFPESVMAAPPNDSISAVKIQSDAVVQAKLKTSSGEVSTATSGANLTLPGGEYGFYPQIKSSYNITAQIRGGAAVAGAYVTNIYLASTGIGGQTAYAKQRYVTASGKDHWIFLLVDKNTKEIMASYQAPDHPCCGQGGDENDIPHPFGEVKDDQEVVLVDNQVLNELKNKIGKRSLLTIINEEYTIDINSKPAYKPREIIEVDKNGDKKGIVLKKIKTPQWAKIVIDKNIIELKRREVKTLPTEIKYKKLQKKGD